MMFVCSDGSGRLQVGWVVAARDLQVSDDEDDGYLVANGAVR
jgi:hypothetical protein